MKEQKKPFYCSDRLELDENERCITQCDHCARKQPKIVQKLIDMMKEDEELGLYDVFNDEKRQGVKELIDKHKQEAALKEALLELRKTPMTFEPKQETLDEIEIISNSISAKVLLFIIVNINFKYFLFNLIPISQIHRVWCIIYR